MKTLDLDVIETGTGEVRLDGTDVGCLCSGADIRIRAGEITQVTLHMPLNVRGRVQVQKPRVRVPWVLA